MERQTRAFGLELLFGYMGFLGVGWLWGRRWLIGIILLAVWFPFLIGACLGILNVGKLFLYPVSNIVAAILLLPIYVAIPLLSAYAIRRRLAAESKPAGSETPAVPSIPEPPA